MTDQLADPFGWERIHAALDELGQPYPVKIRAGILAAAAIRHQFQATTPTTIAEQIYGLPFETDKGLEVATIATDYSDGTTREQRLELAMRLPSLTDILLEDARAEERAERAALRATFRPR